MTVFAKNSATGDFLPTFTYKNFYQLFGIGSIALISVILAACSTTPVQEQRPIYVKGASVPQYYIVREGESLSRIAMRYGLDYRRIAAINGLDSNYTIYPGQRLRLTTTSTSSARTVYVQPAYPTPARPIYQQPTYPSATYPQSNTPSRITTQPMVVANTASQNWLRPVNGSLIRLFNPSSNILGNWYTASSNTPVVATQAGTVIYVGSDLPEYGKLVMIQHNKDFISAYAHLNSFNVQEKQTVQAGQMIGTVGYLPGNNQPVVEFKIRYRGMPVNPATYVK